MTQIRKSRSNSTIFINNKQTLQFTKQQKFNQKSSSFLNFDWILKPTSMKTILKTAKRITKVNTGKSNFCSPSFLFHQSSMRTLNLIEMTTFQLKFSIYSSWCIGISLSGVLRSFVLLLTSCLVYQSSAVIFVLN